MVSVDAGCVAPERRNGPQRVTSLCKVAALVDEGEFGDEKTV